MRAPLSDRRAASPARVRRVLLGVVVSALVAWGLQSSVSAQSLPVGFVDQAVVTGLNLPTAFTALPDGRLLITEKQGLVRVFKNGALLSTPFIDLQSSVNDYWDHGLLGIAADLSFPSNGYVYLLFTYENNAADYSGGKTSRLIRVTASGDVASPASAVTILGTTVGSGCNNFPVGTDCIPSENPSHSIGNVKVASDGTLFVTSGDAASFNVVDDDALRAQNLDSLAGKLLHVTRTGQGLLSNPFWNGSASANRSKVYAYGMRNPFRFALHPDSGLPYLGDVGWGEWEEVDTPNPAAGSVNLGWPCYEGLLHQSGYEPKPACQSLYALGSSAVLMPTITYYHNTGGSSAVVGGTFYTGTSFPAQYRGAYFYADYAVGFIRYFMVDSTGTKSGPLLGFGANLGNLGPVDLETDGENLLYVAINSGEIRRISYAGPDSGVRYLSDMTWVSMTNGLGPVERDQSNGGSGTYDGRVITLDGIGHAKGLGARAASDVRYALSGVCTSFQTSIGIDDEVGANGTVVFQIWADGVKVYDSGTMTGNTAAKTLNIPVGGVNELRLVVTNGGDNTTNDNADWADARVTCSNGGGSPSPYLSDWAWTSAVNGYGPVERDQSNGEDQSGDGHPITLNGVIYAKGLGVHATADVRYALNGQCTALAAVVGVDDEVGANGSVVFQVWNDGVKRYDSGVLTGTSASGNVSVDVTGVSELRLLMTPGTDGSDYDHGDWADARVTCGGTADTTPPTVIAQSPAPGITGVPVTANVTATFSEAMTASTLTATTVTLVVQGTTTPLAATVTYDAATRTVTLDPSASLTASTTYTATIKGGSSGAKDLAGNPLAADSVWSFTTAAPGTSTFLSDLAWTSAVNGYGPVERDQSNGEDQLGDGHPITLNGVTYAKGLGVHATADVRYALNGQCAALAAVVGVDDEVGANGSVVFQVWNDGVKRYDSGVLTGTSASENVSVDVTGVSELRLLMTPSTDGSDYDHGDWANARVTCSGTGNTPPTVTITQPQPTLLFTVGDVINYAGSATDAQDGTIPAANLAWQITLYHCPTGVACHTHPFTSSTGASGSFTVPDHDDGVYFQISLTATDSGGLSTTASVNIYPRTIQLTLDTTPTGLTVVYGGTSYKAPATFAPVVGSTRTIYAPSPQGVLSFIQWSDGGAESHNIVIGSTNVTYVATFLDITAPTITAITPNADATRVNATVRPSATFSEPMNAATITSTTVTLVQQGTTTPVSSTVTYDATTQTVTIRPSAKLLTATTYTVTIRGGSGGVKDPAGNAMAVDRVWSFTTR